MSAEAVRRHELRFGVVNWVRAYVVMTRWELARLRLVLPTMAIVEVLLGAGFVLGVGLFFSGPVTTPTALYLATGVPVITLYVVGLVLLPQVVGQQKVAQVYDFNQSLPVPRSTGFVAWYSINLVVGVPGMVVSLIVAALRYHLTFQPSPVLLPAVMLVALASTAIGYAMGHASPMPMLTNVLTQVLNFFALGFSPIAFPSDRLPAWLALVNHVLPFEAMGTVMRSGLSPGLAGGAPAAYALLAAWTLGCLLVAAAAVNRRA